MPSSDQAAVLWRGGVSEMPQWASRVSNEFSVAPTVSPAYLHLMTTANYLFQRVIPFLKSWPFDTLSRLAHQADNSCSVKFPGINILPLMTALSCQKPRLLKPQRLRFQE